MLRGFAKWPPIDRARKKHALALLREGRSYKDVAAVTNLSVSTLSRYVRGKR